MRTLLKNFRRNDSGTTAVEFSLIAMAFLTLIFGIFETGRLLLTWNAFQYSLENATRYALVNPDLTSDDITDYISSNMTVLSINPESMNVNINFEEYSGINFLELDGTYTFTPLITFFLPPSWTTITLSAESRLPVQAEMGDEDSSGG